MGESAILNVGAGDTKLIFDNKNPAETIRAGRIVKDMLRRGYALLVEVEQNGEKVFQRVREFREETTEYIIADFDPSGGEPLSAPEAVDEETGQATTDPTPAASAEAPAPRRRGRAIPATGTTRAVAVARSAGG